jgi:hypothetical protein
MPPLGKLTDCSAAKIEFPGHHTNQACYESGIMPGDTTKTCPQEARIVVDGTKKVSQATSPSLVSSPRPFGFRLLSLGSSSTNFPFGCSGQP